MVIKKILLLFTVLFAVEVSQGQTNDKDAFAEMDKKYAEKMQQMEQDYARNRERMQKEYEIRIKKMNDEFEKYLKKAFKEVDQNDELVKPAEVPKPIDQPVYQPSEIIVSAKDLAPVSDPIIPKMAVEDAPAYSIAPIVMPVDGMEKYKQPLIIDFFGSEASLYVDSRMKLLSLNSVKGDSFAKYWDDFSKTYYQIYLESLLAYAAKTNLNDWGIYQLIDQSSKRLYGSSNNQEMWKWAMLNQAGYQIKIGYNGSVVCVMLPFMQEVYGKPYYHIGGYNYYLLDDKLGAKSVYTYEDDFGGASKKIDLDLPFALNFEDDDNFVLRKTYLPKEKEPLVLKMNKTTMAFLASYPQTANTVYLNAAISVSVKNALYEYVKPRIVGMSESEAVTYLLNYLHHSFEYKTDRDQFGKEKMFFPDEIFYYPFSDCEDRTVLFTRMVNDLLGLDVVALTYFSHMAAAVSFSSPVEGYSFMVGGQTYTICDPTYIDAPIGSVMPDYKDYTPIAIKISNNNKMSNFWQLIARNIEKDNEGKIFIADRKLAENGKYIVSGWFTDEVKIGDKRYSASNNSRDLWFATFDNKGAMEWFLPVNCSGYGYAQAFNVGKNGNVYALVNYTGAVTVNNRQLCNSDHAAHLILGISGKGETILGENVDYEVPEGKKLAFYGKFKPDGTKVDLLSFPTDRVRFDSQITVDSQNDVVVRGIVGEIEGLTKEVPINLSMASYSAEAELEKYMNDFKKQQYNKHMAPLFAAVKVLSQNGGSISGLHVRDLIRKNNPDFPRENPEVYEGLLRMQFVVNEGGVVKIETYQKKKVSLFSMSINNNSNLQIVQSSNDSYTLNFLNGVQVGKAFIWYDLNSLELNRNGAMLFDYDNDHTRKTVGIDEIVH